MDGGGGGGGPLGGPMFSWFEPGKDSGGRRRGRWFGDDAPWGGRRGTVLLGLLLLILVVLFVVSCLT